MARRLSSFSFLRYFLVGRHHQWAADLCSGAEVSRASQLVILVAVVVRNSFKDFALQASAAPMGLGDHLPLNILDSIEYTLVSLLLC